MEEVSGATGSDAQRAEEGLSAATLAAQYRAVRRTTAALCEPLSEEDCAVQSMPDASPAKWHLAHTSWFFETFILNREGEGYQPFHPAYQFLFNSYYNTVGPQHARPKRGLLSRPSFKEVLAYRAHVDRHLLALLSEGGNLSRAALAIIRLGLHHEQQHQELILTDIKHLFSCNSLRPAYRDCPVAPSADPKPVAWHHYPEGLRGTGHGGGGFAFDNESPRHRVFLEAFELASRPVTNGEFLAFIEDEGYARPDLWLSDGWNTVQKEGWRAPLYWEKRDDQWRVLTLGGERALRLDEPVCHASLYEADAYARWAGARLPGEAEWECAATDVPVEGNFADDQHLHPAPAPGGGERPVGLFGGVWEWTRSAYAPYPGYAPPDGALGEYNGKFMCNQVVLRGGSCVTPRSHIRPTYRNFFFPSDRWQFSGFRLARDAR